MAEVVGSAFLTAQNESAAFPRRFQSNHLLANYFDTDFLNMRSIFSLVASQQAWLA
jgi:hypothetical protein